MNAKLFTSSLVKQAVYFAAERHDGQYRKGTIVPFFVHPMLVALGVSEYTNDPNLVAAAVLHDVLEDSSSTIKELTEISNEVVIKIVQEVTFIDVDKENFSWKERKQKYINHITNASNDALLIAAVDKMTNMQSYFKYTQGGGVKELKKLFGGMHDEYIWYYTEIGKILKNKLNNKPITIDYINMLAHHTNKHKL